MFVQADSDDVRHGHERTIRECLKLFLFVDLHPNLDRHVFVFAHVVFDVLTMRLCPRCVHNYFDLFLALCFRIHAALLALCFSAHFAQWLAVTAGLPHWRQFPACCFASAHCFWRVMDCSTRQSPHRGQQSRAQSTLLKTRSLRQNR